MSSVEYYFENFESYSKIFSEHVGHLTKLMKTLDDEVIATGLPPVGKTRDLFQMTFDLLYHVDQSYKSVYNIQEEDSIYVGRDRLADTMREVLKEEFNRYMGYNSAEP